MEDLIVDILSQLKKDFVNLLNEVLNDDIDEETKTSYQYFNIELSKKSLKRNESYKERKITVYNLYRQEDEIVNSIIIGLALHIDWCNKGETGTAEKSFSSLYEKLLFEALDTGMISYEALKQSNDYYNSKLIRNTTSTYFPKQNTEERCILEVHSCYPLKDYLKRQGFKYNESHQSWDTEVSTNSVEQLKEAISNKCKTAEVKTRHINKIVFGLRARVCITGYTYKFKDILKANKYYYENKKWYKNIQADMYLQEKNNIYKVLPAGQGLKIDIEY